MTQQQAEQRKRNDIDDVVQIANVSSTLGSIGDKAKYMKDDDARKAMPFAAKIPAYKMSKVGSALHPSR